MNKDPGIAAIDKTVAKISKKLSKPRDGLNPVFAFMRTVIPIRGLRLDATAPVGTYELESIIKAQDKLVQAKIKTIAASIRADSPDPDLAAVLWTLDRLDRSVDIVEYFAESGKDVKNLTLALLALRILDIDETGHHSINPDSLMMRYLNIDEFYNSAEV